MREPLLSVIIPNYNGADLFRRNLPSVFKAVDKANFSTEIIVVDDASTDKSLELLQQYPSIKVVQRSVNGGFSEACNSGLAEAKGRYLFFLNSDATVDPDFLAYFRGHFKDESVFAITPIGLDFSTGSFIDGGKIGRWKFGAPRTTKRFSEQDAINKNLSKPYPSFAVCGAYFICDADKMKTLGGFDPLYSPFNFEDIDLCYRALKLGWKCIFEPRMKANHQRHVTLKKVASPFRIRVISKRNQMIFVLLNIHSPLLLLSFVFFLGVRLVFVRTVHWVALIHLVPMLPRIFRRRREVNHQAVVSDRTLFRTYDWL